MCTHSQHILLFNLYEVSLKLLSQYNVCSIHILIKQQNYHNSFHIIEEIAKRKNSFLAHFKNPLFSYKIHSKHIFIINIGDKSEIGSLTSAKAEKILLTKI